ncbi:MAG: CHAT domain-containing protein [Comamonadaceae bacterium]|nr:MAG: CHAT domain-containing protein [Comamonadaceae bacterium]
MDGVLYPRLRMALASLGCLLVHAAWAGESDVLRAQGEAARRRGDVDAAIVLLLQAREQAATPAAAATAALSLGAALLQARRLEEAREALDAAHRATADASSRAAAALELGNLAMLLKQPERARAFYLQVTADGEAGGADVLAAQVNLARLAPAADRAKQIAALLPRLLQWPDAAVRAQLLLNAGELATQAGPAGLPVAHASLAQARSDSQQVPASRSHVAALAGLAGLYESQGRWDEVLQLGQSALDAAQTARPPQTPRQLQDLLMAVEWRQARAWRQQGRADLALAAAMRAVEHAQAVRPDLPIEAADGRSSYQAVLQPLLELFVDLQLAALDQLPAARQAVALTRVRDAVEAMRQSEMQDFLGDRCTVEEADAARLEPGAVALYPILLSDRLELLVQTRDTLRRVTVPVPRTQVVAAARDLAGALRTGQDGYLAPARRLYDWLVRPVEGELEGRHTLVVVPDGPLRLVPFAALNDGQQPLLQRIALGTVTGMSMTDAGRPRTGRISALLAGVAEPGPVVEKLALGEVLRPAPSASLTGRAPMLAQRTARSAARALGAREAEAMRRDLALPGVRDEVAAIAALTGGKVLLDGAFTVRAFEREAEGGDYRVVHIASHGVFGGSADTSYILAFDDLLGINRLQSVLRSDKLQQSPIDLLTLSACETADGNDRAPLGIAGAAMRARARSVLGTLWPVDDDAARQLMESFYRGLARDGQSKAAALREAQLALLRQPVTRHPYFWAPFSLIGNWR